MRLLLRQYSENYSTKFCANGPETPGTDPYAAERLALAAELSAERAEVSAELIDHAMGIARAVSGVDVDTQTGEFKLQHRFFGINHQLRVPIGSLPSAEEAQAALGLFRELIDSETLYAEGDSGEEFFYVADDEPVPYGEILALIGLEGPAESLPEIVVTEPNPLSMTTGTPLDPTAEDLLPPVAEPVLEEAVETEPVVRAFSPDLMAEMQDIYEAHGLGDFYESHLARLTQHFRRLRSDEDFTAALPALERFVLNTLREEVRNSHQTARDTEDLLTRMNRLTQTEFGSFIVGFRNDAASVAETYLAENPEFVLETLTELSDDEAIQLLIERGEDPVMVESFIRILEQGLPEDRGPLLNLIIEQEMPMEQAMQMAEFVGEINRAMEPLLYTDRLSGLAGGSIEALHLRQLRDFKEQILAGTFDISDSDSVARLARLTGDVQEMTEAFIPQAEIEDENILGQHRRLNTLLQALIGEEGSESGTIRDEVQAATAALRSGDIEAATAAIQVILERHNSAWFEIEKGIYSRAQIGTGELEESFDPASGLTTRTEIMRDLTAEDIANSDEHLATFLRFIRDTRGATQATLTHLQAEGLPEDEEMAMEEVREHLAAAVEAENLVQYQAQAETQVNTLLQAIRNEGNPVKIAAFEDFLAQGGEADLVHGFQENLAVIGALNNYILENPDGALPSVVAMYDDMMGISPDEWSDEEVRQGWDRAMMASMLLPGIGFGGYLLRGSQIALRGLNGAVRTRNAITQGTTFIRATLGFSDEAGRLRALTSALNAGDDIPTLLAAARTAGTPTDEVLTAALRAGNSMDDLYLAVGSNIDEFLRVGATAGNRSGEVLQFALQRGASLDALAPLASSSDELALMALNGGRTLDEVYTLVGNMDDFIRLSVQTPDRMADIMPFVMRNGAAMDHMATLGATFDDMLSLASQAGRLDDALVYGLQSGRASIDDLYRFAGSNLEDVISVARQAGWNADDMLVLAINQGTNVDRILEVARVAGVNLDELAMQAMLNGGRVGQPFNGARIAELIRANGGNVDEFMRAAQARGATPQTLSAVGRSVGYSDDAIARVLNVTDEPGAMFTAPRMGLAEDGAGLIDDTLLPGTGIAPILRPTVGPRPLATGGLLDDAYVIPQAARVASELPAGSPLISLGRAREIIQNIPGVARGVTDDLAPRLARLQAGVTQSADDFMAAFRALPPNQQSIVRAGLGTAASAAILALISDIFVPGEVSAEPAAAEAVVDAPLVLPAIDPIVVSPAPEPTPVPLDDVPEVIEETVPTLEEQMEAITARDIRSQAEALREIFAERIDSYQPGQWREISQQIAILFEIDLTGETEEETENNIRAFGTTMQARIRNLLNIEDGENEALEDGLIGPQTMRFMDRALMSVSEAEITDQAEALMNFEAQDGGWRANNRALAELFGINFAADATDEQLKVFGRSIQAFAGGTDGAIGSRTLARMQERLAALSDA